MAFVVDNSVVSGWYLESQATPYTHAIAERLHDDRAWAPAVFELELTNVLRTACMRKRMTASHAQSVLTALARLPIDIDRHPAPRSEVLALALRFKLSRYDAAYLEVALRRQLPMATQDGALWEAAVAAGVGCVEGQS